MKYVYELIVKKAENNDRQQIDAFFLNCEVPIKPSESKVWRVDDQWEGGQT